MENIIFGTIGIIVSISLFLLSYRQTIGAKKERIHQANNDIEKILVRRIVLESYPPNLENISRLIEGKARDFKVKVNDLMSESQFLNTIFTRILETDFINHQQREDVFQKLYPVIEAAETQPIEEFEIERIPSSTFQFFQKSIFPIIVGVIASVISGLIALIPELSQINSQWNLKDFQISSNVILIAFITFVLIFIIFLIKRFKESQEETNDRKTSVQEYFEFEKEVLDILKKFSSVKYVAGPDKGYDFNIVKNKVLLEFV